MILTDLRRIISTDNSNLNAELKAFAKRLGIPLYTLKTNKCGSTGKVSIWYSLTKPQAQMCMKLNLTQEVVIVTRKKIRGYVVYGRLPFLYFDKNGRVSNQVFREYKKRGK